ncbi:MAG: hypothetical protein HGA78_07765, partial [Nitrospirales bacterium]|nr:hypothetical protein [Nitrospirales bacterium]
GRNVTLTPTLSPPRERAKGEGASAGETGTDDGQHKQRKRKKGKGKMKDWITEVELEDLLEGDAALIHDHCGLDVLLSLLENLPGITLYLSEKPLFEAKKRYIRKVFDRTNPQASAKALAIKLKVSERFVYEALATTDKKDDRQQSMFHTEK